MHAGLFTLYMHMYSLYFWPISCVLWPLQLLELFRNIRWKEVALKMKRMTSVERIKLYLDDLLEDKIA